MPKIHRRLLDDVVNATVGYITYSKDFRKMKQFRELSGMTRGQYKRFVLSFKHTSFGGEILRVHPLTIRKMEILHEHRDSPHLLTLLKIVDAQHDPE